MPNMADALLRHLRQTLPDEIGALVHSHLRMLEDGRYEEVLQGTEARQIFGHEQISSSGDTAYGTSQDWSDYIFQRLGSLLADRTRPERQVLVFCIGYAALLAFLQSNVTGPPLPFSSARLLFPPKVAEDKAKTETIRNALLSGFGVDGIAAYKLTSHVELLCLADAVMTYPAIAKNISVGRWAKLRVEFMQQRLLSEVSSTLQQLIYDDLSEIQRQLFDASTDGKALAATEAEFLIERASIHIHHGFDKLARADLERATELRHFKFALTGLLGKRTKFQQKDVSQLVVLAQSNQVDKSTNGHSKNNEVTEPVRRSNSSQDTSVAPTKLDLNDDTLLESISFSERPSVAIQIQDQNTLPPGLSALDPSDQPQLDATDSTILLALASSITNISPADGLTREETLPYATRVLDGSSSNWQVYTQALLVRSRIEGYKSRTVERGLLQLQALVDQVTADTTSAEAVQTNSKVESSASTFLPKAKEGESAPAKERLRYTFLLACPTRWELESELANRWVQLGGLRSALDIFERLQMWAEAALCWAATDREDKAKSIVRQQLFHVTSGDTNVLQSSIPDDEKWEGPARNPPPLDAPRLYCILGDINQDPEMWEKAWEVSKMRYARAQRSLGRYYLTARDYVKAAAAYSKSLKVNQLNHGSWFALGCVLLELTEFERAAEAFSRCVQLDDTDAEAWSNFAAALLRLEPSTDGEMSTGFSHKLDDEEDDIDSIPTAKRDPQKNRSDALKALKRAASLKHDSFRIWQNVLVVAASLSPPDYTSVLSAQKRIIDLRGSIEGEKCIDVEILEMLVQHVITTDDTFDATRPGLARMLVKFIDENVVPLITASADLWRMVSKLALWRNKPSSALDAEEKAWRAVTSQPGWETENETRWNDVVEATVRLCDSYESLGPKERTEGMGAGAEVVAKDWKFKARSAIRGVMGRGKDTWEGTDGWLRLQDALASLRG